jgi:Flp pilus assembly protein TadD
LQGAAGLGLIEDGETKPLLTRARQAVDLWRDLAVSVPDRAQGLVWRGLIQGFSNDYAGAIADLRGALDLDPDHFAARMHLAISLARQDPEEAVSHLRLLRQRHPENKEVCFSLAAVHRALGQLDEARTLLDEILAADPRNISALVEQGYVAMNTQQFEEAERRLRKALAIAPNEPEVLMAMSGYFQATGKREESRQFYDKGLQIERERTSQREEMVRKRRASARP